MCGIYGFSGTKSANQDKLKVLAIYNETRGKHSHGEMIFDFRSKSFKTQRKVGNVIDTISDGNYGSEIKSSKTYIGHTRHATKGAITLENTHPFEFENVCGVHNGTLIDHEYLVKHFAHLADDPEIFKKLDVSKTLCDSYNLYNLIDTFGYKQVLEKFNGAAALAFTDRTGKLFLFHNDQRPLFIGELPKEGIYFSSMENSLKAIGCDQKSILELDLDTVFVIENGEIVDSEKIDRSPLERPVETILGNDGVKGGKRTKRSFQNGKENGSEDNKIIYEDVINRDEKTGARVPTLRSPTIDSVTCKNALSRRTMMLKYKNGTFCNFTMGVEPNAKSNRRDITESMIYLKHTNMGNTIPVLLRIFSNGDMEEFEIANGWYESYYIPRLIQIHTNPFKSIKPNSSFSHAGPAAMPKRMAMDEIVKNAREIIDQAEEEIVNTNAYQEFFIFKMSGKAIPVAVINEPKDGKVEVSPLDTKYQLYTNIKFEVPEIDLLSMEEYLDDLEDNLMEILSEINAKFPDIDRMTTRLDMFTEMFGLLASVPSDSFLAEMLEILDNINYSGDDAEVHIALDELKNAIDHQIVLGRKQTYRRLMKDVQQKTTALLIEG